MSRHRVKNVGYDDDHFEDDDGYDSPDPEEQEFLQQCTAAVLGQLRAGQPSVTATTEEVQEALWHYYNDIEKAVNYLRGMYLFSSSTFPCLGDSVVVLVVGVYLLCFAMTQ
jgi:elongation factor 1 alpha-like protein